MPFTGSPLDEELFRASYLKEFHESYGEGADAVALYELQPTWIRFAAAFPRQAYLLDSLWRIYSDIHTAMLDFAQLLARVDPDVDWQKIGFGFGPNADAFAFFCNNDVEAEEHVSLLQLSWAFHQGRHGRLDYLLRACAHDFVTASKAEDRASILEELLQAEGDNANALRACQPRRNVGFWTVRRKIIARDRILRDTLDRIRKNIETDEAAPRAKEIVHAAHNTDLEPEGASYEYGNGRITRFADEPTRSRSPPAYLNMREAFDISYRSRSRDSARSSVYPGSSITTYAPEAPEDRFSVSVRVFSAVSQSWVESIANYDTGCDAGNFISSSFVEDLLQMGDAIEEDPEADSTRIMDIGGSTTFRPRGRIKLTWYGRNLHKGRKGKRSEQFTGWFRVAPRPLADLPAEQSEPFQILLGKDFIDENEIFTYRGFRLFRVKKQPTQQDTLELDRRQRLRQEMEDERRIERQTSDAASIMTGTSVSSPSLGGAPGSPRSSSQSLLMTSTTTNGGVVNVHAVS